MPPVAGYRKSESVDLTATGDAVGHSARFDGISPRGQSAWAYDTASGTTTRIGFWDAEYTFPDGSQYSEIMKLGDNGWVVGVSERASSPTGCDSQSLWTYRFDSDMTQRINLPNAGHVFVRSLSEDSLLLAEFTLCDPAGPRLGRVAALHNLVDGSTEWLGLHDSEHQRTDGWQIQTAQLIHGTRYAVGRSTRFLADKEFGSSAWIADIATGATTRLGFVDAEHTRADGYQNSSAGGLYGLRWVPGFSERFTTRSDPNVSAWMYDLATQTTVRIGLMDSDHTSPFGSQSNGVYVVNDAGQAAGVSFRYCGYNLPGRSAWIWDPTTAQTRRIGLTGEGYTAPLNQAGCQFSYVRWQNQAGHVVGNSWRYVDSTQHGIDTWLYDPATDTNTRINLDDAEHTRDDGYRYGFAQFVSNAGQAFGFSTRYVGSAEAGQTAWVFDIDRGQTIPLVFSRRPDGYAYSQVAYAGDDGLILGTYTAFSASGADLGQRAFIGTVADGFQDLGEVIVGGLAGHGWRDLLWARPLEIGGRIQGEGRLIDQNIGAVPFLLVPIPEPTTAPIAISGVALVFLRYRARYLSNERTNSRCGGMHSFLNSRRSSN